MSEDQFRSVIREEILNFMTENLKNTSSTSPSAPGTESQLATSSVIAQQSSQSQLAKSSVVAQQNSQSQLAKSSIVAQRSGQQLKPREVAREVSPQGKPSGTDLIRIGELVANCFKVMLRMKTGGFGQAYEAFDTKANRPVLLKIEKIALSDYLEMKILKEVKGKQHFPVLLHSGTVNECAFVVTQSLGRHLSEIRHSCPLKPARLSMSAAYRCSIQCLEAVEELHNTGWIHRDPKPSNFATGKETADQGTIYILDYGLCRKFVGNNGMVIPARETVGFRGTVRYASLAAHENKELSRRDDLWSLYYLFIELLTGQLPWRKTNDKAAVAKLKVEYSPETLAKAFPSEVEEIVQHIRRLQYADKPDYRAIRACFTKMLTKNNMKLDDPYDWQVADCKTLLHWAPPN